MPGGSGHTQGGAGDGELILRTGLVYDDLFLEHGPPEHPENRRRLQAIMQRLAGDGLLAEMRALPARPATEAEVCRLHAEDYLEHLRLVSESGGGSLDIDTVATERSYGAALVAAGSCIDAARAVFDREVDNALCLVRPPGHHARPDTSMGFCLLNNIALAAEDLLRDRARSVAIVDFDAHHGNGTQEMFYYRRDLLYISLHQAPFWPGTGTVDEVGAEDGFGRNLNIPMLAGAEDRHFARAFDEVVLPALTLYEPDAILVSAGYDGHFRDPLPDLQLTATGFFEMTRKLVAAAAELCEGRIVLALEGGYDLPIGLVEGVEASARALLGLGPVEWTAPDETPHPQVTERVEETLDAVIALHTERWLS